MKRSLIVLKDADVVTQSEIAVRLSKYLSLKKDLIKAGLSTYHSGQIAHIMIASNIETVNKVVDVINKLKST